MKKNSMISLVGILILFLALLVGCSAAAADHQLEQIEETIDHHLDAAEDAAETMVLNILTTDPLAPPATNPPAAQEPAAQLTAEEAKAIALAHAGFTDDQVKWLRSEYEIDDGIPEFEVEFRSGDTEYDYTIHAESGEIRHWDKDYEPVKTAPEATQPPATEAPAAQLTAEEAKAIALEHAGFTADQVTHLRAEFDWDDGVPTWDVEFREGHWEYDYEIHAETGQIRSFDKDD